MLIWNRLRLSTSIWYGRIWLPLYLHLMLNLFALILLAGPHYFTTHLHFFFFMCLSLPIHSNRLKNQKWFILIRLLHWFFTLCLNSDHWYCSMGCSNKSDRRTTKQKKYIQVSNNVTTRVNALDSDRKRAQIKFAVDLTHMHSFSYWNW